MISRQHDSHAGDPGSGSLLERGRYRVRLALDDRDLARAQALRGQAFLKERGTGDADEYDPLCRHVLIEDRLASELVGCFRYMWFEAGGTLDASYSAQFYDLGRLAGFGGAMLELGRFCIRPGARDADILRLAWGALTGIMDRGGGALMFGCASFRGIEPAPYAEAFALLRARHMAPGRWRVGVRAAEVVRFADMGAGAEVDARAGMRAVPPLLRSYLSMGGWVSDHAVVDRDMNTLHVFTGVETAAIPPARARALRAILG